MGSIKSCGTNQKVQLMLMASMINDSVCRNPLDISHESVDIRHAQILSVLYSWSRSPAPHSALWNEQVLCLVNHMVVEF